MTEMIKRRAHTLGALALLLLALVAPIGAVRADRDDARKLLVPAGNRVDSWAYAEGVQIYRWNGATWAFVAPEAVLYSGDDEDDVVVGIHYVGPTWESTSGSKVVGAVVDRWTPDPDAIPWLLLKATSSEGPGVFHQVTYIQRLFTVGGLAPADPGDFVGEEVRVPYSAWYVFYKEARPR